MYGEDYRYAASRLNNTIVRKGNSPIMVHDISSCDRVHYTDLATHKEGLCSLNELNVKPIPLGWSNNNLSCYYSARAPLRRDWRQGLRIENIRTINYRGVRVMVDPARLVVDMLSGYPSFKKALSMSKKANFKGVAWGRDWAMDNNDNLLWRFGQIVGRIVDGVPVLAETNNYLKESLEESL